MAGWSGFSDDDLRKMRQTSLTVGNSSRSGVSLKSTKQTISTRTKVIKDIRTQGADTVSNRANQTLSDSLKPLQAQAKSCPDAETKSKENHEKSVSQVVGEVKNNVSQHSNDGKTDKVIGELTQASQADLNGVKELDESEALSFELNNVQKFQIQQKVIEEANKHKRALLAKAIEDRRKQAKAEAEKLMKVQQELNHLDSLLTADVSIIRDKIEIASLEYNDAQKRYEKAEKEFVAAKMDLFSKGEVKEQLTQHLYTIIHQNEVRKAKKLVELMEKLAMDVTPEEMELTIPAIPQLTNFTAVATLHDPNPARSNKGCNEENVGAQKLSKADGLESANVSKHEVNNTLPNGASKEVESVGDLPEQKLCKADGLGGAKVSVHEVIKILPDDISKEVENVGNLPAAVPVADHVNVEIQGNQEGCVQVPTPTIEYSGANISCLNSANCAPDANKDISHITSEEAVVVFSKQQEKNVLGHCQEDAVIDKDISSQNSLVSSLVGSVGGWTHPFT